MTRPKIITLFMTVAVDTVFIVVIFEGLLFFCLIDNDDRVTSSKTIAQFKTRVQNHTLFKTKVAKLIPYL